MIHGESDAHHEGVMFAPVRIRFVKCTTAEEFCLIFFIFLDVEVWRGSFLMTSMSGSIVQIGGPWIVDVSQPSPGRDIVSSGSGKLTE